MYAALCCCYIEAMLVDRLLKEAEPLEEKRNVEMGDERSRAAYSEDDNIGDGLEQEERKLLSRYGVWLLVELTPVREDVPIVSLMYSISAQSYHTECTILLYVFVVKAELINTALDKYIYYLPNALAALDRL